MAQHNYVISNASFPNVRSEINNVLSAINSSNSGTSRPSSATTGTIWLDTTNSGSNSLSLKFFDGAQDIELATVDTSANTVNFLDSVTSGVADNAITLAKLASGTDGNLISYDASGNPVAVATGSSGQVLVSAGAGAVPSFQTVSGNATHSGEVTGATALTIADNIVDEANLKVSNAPVNGYMLTAQSGNTGGMTWAEAGGGAWNLLSTVTASDDGRIDCTLSGSYFNYAIILSGLSPVTDNTQLLVRMGTASNSNDTGSNYRYVCRSSLDDGGNNGYNSQSEDKGKIVGDSLGNAAGESLEATIHIGHDSDHQNSTRLNILSAHTGNAGRSCTNQACVVYNPRVAVTKVNFFMNSGNINYGTFKVYGIS